MGRIEGDAMDEKTAKIIVDLSMAASAEIDRSVELVVTSPDKALLRDYRRHAGMIMASIFHDLIVPVYKEFPHLAPDWYKAMDAKRAAEKE